MLYLVSATIWFLLACNPLRAQWDLLYRGQLEEPPNCIDARNWAEVYNVAHVVQGVILLMSLIIILWQVKIEIKKKMRLFFIWGCGLLAVLCGLLRILDTNFTTDIFWSYTQLLIWTSLDVTVGIVVISLPVLDTMIAAGVRGVISKTRKTDTGGRSGYGNLDLSKISSGTSGASMTTKRANIIGPGRGVEDAQDDVLHKVDQKPSNAKHSPVELNIMRTVEYAVRYGIEKQGETYVLQPKRDTFLVDKGT